MVYIMWLTCNRKDNHKDEIGGMDDATKIILDAMSHRISRLERDSVTKDVFAAFSGNVERIGTVVDSLRTRIWIATGAVIGIYLIFGGGGFGSIMAGFVK